MEKNALTEFEELTLNNRSKGFLKEITKWAYFLSIIGFIGLGLMLILAAFSGVMFNNLPNAQVMPFDMGLFMSILYVVMALIYFFPIYYLFKFSTKMKIALSNKSDTSLSDALEMLKSHYKFIGILTIVIMSLYALIFVFSLIGVFM